MKIDAERLRGFLDCMHDEADERDKRSAQIGAIVKAAKEAGYDTKAVRKVFVRERMDAAERTKQDDLLETYEGALGGKGRALRAIEVGVRVGEACAANGVHRATVARARRCEPHVAKQVSNATPDHDPETGEIVRPMLADDLGDPLLITNPFRAKVKAIAAGVKSAPDKPPSPAPEFGVGPGTADDLTIPAFLKREQVTA